MPYVARKRLKVGETDEVIGREVVTLKAHEQPDGDVRIENVYGDIHQPIYRDPGEEVPEAESWSIQDIEQMVSAGYIMLVEARPKTRQKQAS